MNLYFLNYNNYYNRIIKKEVDINDYLQHQVGNPAFNIQFNPNDGINTEYITNRKLDTIGDYLLCINELGAIDSRWFILSANRTRAGQYILKLRRDLIVDYYTDVVNAPMFIEKAMLDSSDPFIFNNEQMTFNQIKTSETLLTDKSGVPCIVGYYARTDGQTPPTKTELSGEFSAPLDSLVDIEVDNILTWKYYKYVQTGKPVLPLLSQYCGAEVRYNNENTTDYMLNKGKLRYWGYTYDEVSEIVRDTNLVPFDKNVRPEEIVNRLGIDYQEILNEEMDGKVYTFEESGNNITHTLTVASENTYNELLELSGKYIKDLSTGKVYEFRLLGRNNYNLNNLNFGINSIDYPNTYGKIISSLFNTMFKTSDGSPITGDPFSSFIWHTLGSTWLVCSFSLLEQQERNYSYLVSNTRYSAVDCPYDVFAIPYGGNIKYKDAGGSIVTLQQSQSLSFATAMSIAEKYAGSGTLYDLQLLPYLPTQAYIDDDGYINLTKLTEKVGYDFIREVYGENLPVGAIIHCPKTSFTLDIPVTPYVSETDPIEKKVQTLCDMHRLCSPNYNGQFEFSAERNGGFNKFNVDCTYKPYNPYIHINPDWGMLYGSDFNDARGLIVNGEFSLPIVTDAWKTYEIQNKNYLNIFDRQIKNMEINNAFNNSQGIIGAISNLGQGVASGMMASGGNPIGGIAGGIASAIGGALDVGFNVGRQQEAIDYTRDQFGYQLGNIRALPDSIAKTSAFTYNNKIFPILEYYTCTPQEKEALRNKIRYNGMTVMRIGKMNDYTLGMYNYIKGKVIRLSDISSNSRIAYEIANEIDKGVFI